MEFVERNNSEGGFYEDGQEEIVVGESSNSIKQPFSSSSSPSSQYGNLVHHHHHQEQQFHVGAAEVVCIEKEHMFDKVVTPSDVGKLNRLVIPKQHAEKYFPLDSTANEKGLLLNFEDTSGKPWTFRYSYWNSSQSYVMTKGWSRFVKEKKLDAGDIVSFERGADESIKDRFFIDWRRRPNAPGLTSLSLQSNLLSLPRTIVPWGRLFLPDQQSAGISSALSMGQEHFQLNYDQQQHYYHHHLQHQHHNVSIPSSSSPNSYGYSEVNHPGSSVYYGYSEVNHPGSSVYYSSSSTKTPPEQVGLVQRRSGDNAHLVFESVPVVHGKAAAKRVRLFGVNLECPISEDNPHEHDFHSLTTTMPTGSTSLACNSHMNHHNNSNPSHPLLQLRVFNGAPLPTLPIELPKRGRNSLSLDFDI